MAKRKGTSVTSGKSITSARGRRKSIKLEASPDLYVLLIDSAFSKDESSFVYPAARTDD